MYGEFEKHGIVIGGNREKIGNDRSEMEKGFGISKGNWGTSYTPVIGSDNPGRLVGGIQYFLSQETEGVRKLILVMLDGTPISGDSNDETLDISRRLLKSLEPIVKESRHQFGIILNSDNYRVNNSLSSDAFNVLDYSKDTHYSMQRLNDMVGTTLQMIRDLKRKPTNLRK